MLFLSLFSFSQSIHTGWIASFNTFTTSKNTSIHFDAQFRSADEWKHMQTLLLRPGINRKVSDRTLASMGYAYIGNRRTISIPDDLTGTRTLSGVVPEHRIWQQLIYTHPLAHTTLAHRFRLEQRFLGTSAIKGEDWVNEGNVYANRIRYFFRTILPLTSNKPFKNGIFTAIQNEVLFNVGNNTHVNGKAFDQNRAYLAAGYRVNPRFDLELGYMNQYIQGRGKTFTNNHVLQLACYTRL